MLKEEFQKLKQDEIKWIKLKDASQSKTNYIRERCYFLISLIDDMKFIDISRLKAGQDVSEVIKASKVTEDVNKIIFDDYSKNNYGFIWGEGKDASVNEDMSIQVFNDNENVYILSKNKIFANADSSNMFSEIYRGYKEIIFNNFDTSYVIDMSDMFAGCDCLEGIDFNNFNTSKVVYMDRMLAGCKKIKELDLSNFDVSNVKSMENMFDACTNLIVGEISFKNGSYKLEFKEVEKNINKDFKNTYISEYYKIINEIYKTPSEYSEMKYSLLYFNDDDIPDLMADYNGYFVSLYVYANDKLYTVVDSWPYGVGGNHGYEFDKGTISNWNSDYAGFISTKSLYILKDNMEFEEFWNTNAGNIEDLEESEYSIYSKILEEETPHLGYYHNGEKFNNEEEYNAALRKCLDENNYLDKKLEYIVKDVSWEEIILELGKLANK